MQNEELFLEPLSLKDANNIINNFIKKLAGLKKKINKSNFLKYEFFKGEKVEYEFFDNNVRIVSPKTISFLIKDSSDVNKVYNRFWYTENKTENDKRILNKALSNRHIKKEHLKIYNKLIANSRDKINKRVNKSLKKNKKAIIRKSGSRKIIKI